jgi:hypothetical protein
MANHREIELTMSECLRYGYLDVLFQSTPDESSPPSLAFATKKVSGALTMTKKIVLAHRTSDCPSSFLMLETVCGIAYPRRRIKQYEDSFD